MTVSISYDLAKEILKALEESGRFLRHRDEMNAAVRLSDTRWSPITTLVESAAEHLRNEAMFS